MNLADKLHQAERRLHVIAALAVALEDPVATMAVVAAAADHDAALAALHERFGFDAVQAQAVTDMQIHRAHQYSRGRIAAERDELVAAVAFLRQAQQQHAAVAAHYDARAATYDAGAMHRALADVVADEVGEPGGPVVDVATGTGLVLRAIAARHPATELIGVDLSGSMLAEARGHLPLATLVQGEATNLPVGSGSAALLTCMTALHLLPAPEAAFLEWARVLRPRDGRLVTATFAEAGAPARPDLPQGFERHHEAYRTPERLSAAAVGFRLEHHRTWRHEESGDELLVCVLRPAP